MITTAWGDNSSRNGPIISALVKNSIACIILVWLITYNSAQISTGRQFENDPCEAKLADWNIVSGALGLGQLLMWLILAIISEWISLSLNTREFIELCGGFLIMAYGVVHIIWLIIGTIRLGNVKAIHSICPNQLHDWTVGYIIIQYITFSGIFLIIICFISASYIHQQKVGSDQAGTSHLSYIIQEPFAYRNRRRRQF